MNPELLAWDSFDFPQTHGVIYILGVLFRGKFEPFYVGESSRSQYGRIGEYVSGQATAPTDFKVGKAIECFHEKRLAIKVKFKEASDLENERKLEEEKWRKEITELYSWELLNDADPRDITEVHSWCEGFLTNISSKA